MNQRLELTIEATLDNRAYRLTVPFAAPFEHAFQILDSFKIQLETMQEAAKQQALDAAAQQDQAQQSAS